MFTALRKSPFARLLVFFIGGIYVAMLTGDGNGTLKITMAVILFSFLLVIYFMVCRKPGFHTDWIAGFLAGCLIFSAGFIIMNVHYKAGEVMIEQGTFSGPAVLEIREATTETARSIKTIAGVKYHLVDGRTIPSRQKILVYFEKDSLSSILEPGDMICAYIRLAIVNPPKNPGEFDYRKYLSARTVYHQTYLAGGKWKPAGIEGNKSFRSVAYNMQKKLLDQYRKIGLNNTLYSILSALTLGYKSDLESHTKHIFSQAGVMHVMALSGFNVGVIAVVLTYVLAFIKHTRYGEILRTLIIVVVIWLFVFVTGLSASVTRAAVMITLVLCGKLLHRKINSINILAFSAFTLLTFSPSLLTDISFQLSFAAVFGIIVYYPLLYKLISFKFIIADKLWQMFTLSCAAQLATLPFTLYYFHQFPVYFWLTNLYVVPLVSVIICVAGLYLVLSFIVPVSFILGKLLGLLLGILYKGVLFTEVLPYSLIDHIGVSHIQALIILLVIFLTALAVIYRKRYIVALSLILIVAFQSITIHQAFERRKQQILMVGSCKGVSVVNLINGRNSLLICNRKFSPDDPGILYSLGNFWIDKGIKSHFRILTLDEPFGYCASWLGNNKLFSFSGKRILLLADNSIFNHSSDKPLKLDIVIVVNSIKPDLQSLLNLISPEMIILDSSLSYQQTVKWNEMCKSSEISYWCVRDSGAFCLYR